MDTRTEHDQKKESSQLAKEGLSDNLFSAVVFLVTSFFALLFSKLLATPLMIAGFYRGAEALSQMHRFAEKADLNPNHQIEKNQIFSQDGLPASSENMKHSVDLDSNAAKEHRLSLQRKK